MKTSKSLTEAKIAELPKLPEEWLWVRLDSIGELFCGQSPSIAEVNQERRGVPYVTGPEQWDGSKIEKTKWTEFPKRLVPDGCIFITVKGAGVGKTFPGISCAIGRDIYAFLPSSQVDFKYTLLAIKHQIDLLIMKAQGDIPGLSKNHILDHVIGLCSIEEQRAIVSKIEQLFSELDNGIANLKLAQEQLKVYRQAVLKKAFEGELTKKWREQQTDLPDAKDLLEQISTEREEAAKASGGKVKDIESLTDTELTDLPELPDRWKWVKLQELCNLIGGVTKGRKLEGKKTISLPYLRVANVQDGYLDLSEIKFIDVLEGDLEKYRLIEGDILYTEGGDKDKLGRGTIWKGQIENCIHQNHIFRARPYSDSLVSSYIGYFSQTQTAKNYFFKNAKQTVNLASINLTVLSNLPFPLCSFPEQQTIVQEIETRLSVCDKIEQDIKENLEKAEALRQSILKKAFEGKLLNERELAEVRGAEDWDPAEVLLERIKAEKAGNGKKEKLTTEKLKSIVQEDKGIMQQATLQAFEQIDK